MSVELTQKTQLKAAETTQKPQLVLQIDGVDTIYGVGTVSKYTKIGDPGLLLGDEWVIGGLNSIDNQLDAVSLDESSNTLTQQLAQDKGGTTSIPSIQVSLIDKDEAITRLITPGMVLEDILGVRANVYLGYSGTAWPQDFVRIFSGIIDEVTAGGSIVLNVAHPEQKKRAEIFRKVTTKLTSDVNYRSATIQNIIYYTRTDVVGTVTITYTAGATAGSEVVSVAGNNISVQIETGVTQARHIRNALEKSIEAVALIALQIVTNQSSSLQVVQASTPLVSDAVINVESTKDMLLPVPAQGFRTYVRIDDEVIEYTALTDTTITGVTRGALSLIDERARGAFHKSGDSVDTFYRVEGQAFELALKILMSGPDAYFKTDVTIKSINYVEGIGAVPNALWFENLNIQNAYGLTVGDFVTITGDANVANNVTLALIADIVATPYGSYLVLDGVSLVESLLSDGKASFRSKWNVLPDGAGLALGGDEVDVPEFERLQGIFSSSIFTYDFYLKDTMVGKDFVDTEILFPTGAFTLPRQGKVSVGYTSPPLAISGIKKLDSSNTAKPNSNKIKRSINRNFYNNVLFKYNEAVVDDRFLSGDLDVSQDSKNRIKVGNKTLVIEARGLRPSSDTTANLEILKRRFADKYKLGAETITTQAFYGESFAMDVGDTVIFGDNNLKIPDTKSGSRNFTPRIFEVSNKSLSIKTGEVKLELIDTGYSTGTGRYGVVSPSSLVDAGSTTTSIRIKNSYETVAPSREKSKWTSYVGEEILVHDENYDTLGVTTLMGFSAGDDYLMLVDPPLAFVPGVDYVVDVANYDPIRADRNPISKASFAFTNPTVAITAGVSSTSFDVAPGDVAKFLVGAVVLVRDTEWDFVNAETTVTDVTGNTITVQAVLTYVPVAGYEVDLIGYEDAGAPYRYL